MIRRDALSEYVRGSLWVLPTLSVLVALAAGSLLSEVSICPHSPLAFQGTSDDARTLLIGIAGTMVTVICSARSGSAGPGESCAAAALDPVRAGAAAHLSPGPAEPDRAE